MVVLHMKRQQTRIIRKVPKNVIWAGRIARLLDESIELPGLGYKIGLDPILGLFPVAGDILSAVLGAFIVVVAIYNRLPWATVALMGFNLVLDMVIGKFPIVGDIFDVAFKSHLRNARMLEDYFENTYVEPEPSDLTIDVKAS